MQPPRVRDIALRLNSVAIHLVRRARTVDRELGVPPGQLSALSILVFGGERTIAELADAEHVTSPTMTRIVDGLERAGLAERRPHPDDRRATRVRPTGTGRRVMERGRRNRVELISGLLEQLTAEDLAAVDRAAVVLARALETA
jgi:DNA-binding MarR family transcriptional regulator